MMMFDLSSLPLEQLLTAPMDVVPTITAKGIPGLDKQIQTIVGWALWLISILSLVGLLIVSSVGYESYKHNQGEDFMEKAKMWLLAAVVGVSAKPLVNVFYPGFTVDLTAVPIPGMDGPIRDILGNVVWILQWAALACILFLAAKGFIAFKNDGVQEFVSKFFWFIAGSLGVSLATNIAGAFFPSALSF